MTRAQKDSRSGPVSGRTISRDEGVWLKLRPKVKVKLLHVDYQASTCSLLMRIQPGGKWPAHTQRQDEVCMVLEGEALIGETVLQQGDFHFAPTGIRHDTLHSEQGALLYLCTGLKEAMHSLVAVIGCLFNSARRKPVAYRSSVNPCKR